MVLKSDLAPKYFFLNLVVLACGWGPAILSFLPDVRLEGIYKIYEAFILSHLNLEISYMQYKKSVTLLAPNRKHKEPWLVPDYPTVLKVFTLRLYSMSVKQYFLHHHLPFPKAEMQEGKAGRLQQPWDLHSQLVSSQLTAAATSGVAVPQWGNTYYHSLKTVTL